MTFKKWVNIPEVMQEVEKLSVQAQKYSDLLATKKTEDKIAAQNIWQSMAASYWDILFAYAVGTFRWDSDEDRKLKTPYENIKENKKKSLLAMSQSFCKDYSLWMTKEKKGYRILPSTTHKVFVDMFRTRPDD